MEAGSENTSVISPSDQDIRTSVGRIENLPAVEGCSGVFGQMPGNPAHFDGEAAPAPFEWSSLGDRGLGRVGGKAPCPKGGSTSLDTTQTSVEIGPTLDLGNRYSSEDPGKHKRPGPDGEICGAWWAFECRDCRGTFYAYKGCGDRITCKECRKKYLNRTYARFSPVIEGMKGTLRFMTLTVLNGPVLTERREHLRKSFRKARQRVAWKKIVKGGVYVEETTHSEEFGWHPHVHIIYAGRYFDQKELSEIWKSVTGDSHRVHVRLIKNKEEACRELFKYTLKEKGLPEKILEEARLAFSGRHLVGTFGDLYGEERDNEDQGEDEGMSCPYCGSDSLYRHLPFSWLPRGPPDFNKPKTDDFVKYVPGRCTILPARGRDI